MSLGIIKKLGVFALLISAKCNAAALIPDGFGQLYRCKLVKITDFAPKMIHQEALYRNELKKNAKKYGRSSVYIFVPEQNVTSNSVEPKSIRYKSDNPQIENLKIVKFVREDAAKLLWGHFENESGDIWRFSMFFSNTVKFLWDGLFFKDNNEGDVFNITCAEYDGAGMLQEFEASK